MNLKTRPGAATTHPAGAAGAALVLSLLACYGTLAAVAVLPLLGIVFTPDDTLWRMAIVAPAALAAIALARGAWRHGGWRAFGLALAGSVLLAVLMFWHMNRALEVLAFALLAAAVLDERRRCAGVRGHG